MSIAGWLPQDWSKAIVPLAIQQGENFIPIGTAFLVGHTIDSTSRYCLVTAKHVVFNENGERRNGIFVLANRRGGGGFFTPFDAPRIMPWVTVGNSDVAITLMPLTPSTGADIKVITNNLLEDFSNIREGDDVFFMGFPLRLGVSPLAKITPIVRAGIVAMKNADSSFLIDANVFPGNSGSPVFFRPCPFQFGGEGILTLGNVRPPKLIGILISIITYRDEAISRQTGEVRVIFEENSGLATALSIDSMRNILGSAEFQTACRAVLRREADTPST
jgi:hypothetical protein